MFSFDINEEAHISYECNLGLARKHEVISVEIFPVKECLSLVVVIFLWSTYIKVIIFTVLRSEIFCEKVIMLYLIFFVIFNREITGFLHI